MNTERNATFSGPPAGDSSIATIIRGEDVLAEAREVARTISGRVAQAVTQRPQPDGPRQDRQ